MPAAEGEHGVSGSTLVRVNGADETACEMSGGIWDIGDGRAVSRDNGSWAMVAYVRETWPLLRDASWRGDVLHGQWNGSIVQVAIDCLLCGEQHHHGGSLDGGRCHGHRERDITAGRRHHASVTSSSSAGTTSTTPGDFGSCGVASTRRSGLPGRVPASRDPAVEAAQDSVGRRDLNRARRLLDDVGLPSAAVRVPLGGHGARRGRQGAGHQGRGRAPASVVPHPERHRQQRARVAKDVPRVQPSPRPGHIILGY